MAAPEVSESTSRDDRSGFQTLQQDCGCFAHRGVPLPQTARDQTQPLPRHRRVILSAHSAPSIHAQHTPRPGPSRRADARDFAARRQTSSGAPSPDPLIGTIHVNELTGPFLGLGRRISNSSACPITKPRSRISCFIISAKGVTVAAVPPRIPRRPPRPLKIKRRGVGGSPTIAAPPRQLARASDGIFWLQIGVSATDDTLTQKGGRQRCLHRDLLSASAGAKAVPNNHRPARQRRTKPSPGRPQIQVAEDRVHAPTNLAKARIRLGRIHVHVHVPRGRFQERRLGGITVVVQEVPVGATHRMSQQAVARRAGVDVKKVSRSGSARRGWRSGRPAAGPTASDPGSGSLGVRLAEDGR